MKSAPPPPSRRQAPASINPVFHEDIPFQDWGCLHVALIWVYQGLTRPEGRHRAFLDRASVIEQNITCWLIRKGSVRVVQNGKETSGRPGDWLILADGGHTQDFTDNAELLSVKFQMNWPAGEPLFARPATIKFSQRDHPNLEKSALSLLRQVRKHFPGAGDYLPTRPCSFDTYLQINRLLQPWLGAFTNVMIQYGCLPLRLNGHDPRALDAVRILDRHQLKDEFREKEIATEVGLSRAQLSRVFARDFGMTPRKYLDDRKGEAACQALAHTDLAVKQIAFNLGFHYESHFCAWFKRRKGSTPSEYRRHHSV